MRTGCYTALVTPFAGDALDHDGLDRLVDFQIENGITGILAVGTTGESPTLDWKEHDKVIEKVAAKCKQKALCIAGAGSNNTSEAISAVKHATSCGVDAVLLVDPYYNGPSSLEIRKEYIEPVANAFPEVEVIPYIIPGRTGAQMLPEDLAMLARDCPNVRCVKEATGNLDNMRHTRTCTGEAFSIFSGDDALTCQMMTDPAIRASGVISVASNVAPKWMTKLVTLLSEGKTEEAASLETALSPLFTLVTVTTEEETPFGPVSCRARNPLALKTLMQILGMPAGPCRRPIGKMTRQGVEIVLEVARTVQKKNPEIFAPIAEFFGVDIDARLADPTVLEGLSYDTPY